MRTLFFAMPMRTLFFAMPMRTLFFAMPMRNLFFAMPISLVINAFASITGAGEVDITKDKISELNIHISLIRFINFMNDKA
jgi:hypothetical protein